MKQRNIIVFAVSALLLSAGTVFAETSISFGPAYTSYFVRTDLKGPDVTNIKNALAEALDKKQEVNHAAGVALDITAGYFYTMLQAAFPTKTITGLLKPDSQTRKGGSAVILDWQIGVGYTFFRGSAVNLFVGLGLGLNGSYFNQKFKVPDIAREVRYERGDVMIGAGVNVLLQAFFSEHFGLFAGVSDSVYVHSFKTRKLFNINGKNDYIFDKTEDKNKSTSTLANSLNVKAGFAFRF